PRLLIGCREPVLAASSEPTSSVRPEPTLSAVLPDGDGDLDRPVLLGPRGGAEPCAPGGEGEAVGQPVPPPDVAAGELAERNVQVVAAVTVGPHHGHLLEGGQGRLGAPGAAHSDPNHQASGTDDCQGQFGGGGAAHRVDHRRGAAGDEPGE